MTADQAVAAGPNVSTAPERLVAGMTAQASILIKDLVGTGPIMAAVNIGVIEQVRMDSGQVRIHYKLPSVHFPQMLCLILWRPAGSAVQVVRIPLYGKAIVPVETEPRSKVRFSVGKQRLGPFDSDSSGKLQVPLLVPPGLLKVQAEATSLVGLRTTKSITIKRPPYNQLALLAREVKGSAGEAKVHVVAALAEDGGQRVNLEVGPPASSEAIKSRAPLARIAMKRGTDGLWRTVLAQVPYDAPPRLKIRAGVEGDRQSERTLHLDVTPGPNLEALARASSAQRKRNILLWSGVGLTAALVIAGTVTGQLASDMSDEYRALNTLPQRRMDLDGSASALSTSSIVLYSTGAALAVGTALYYWFGYREARKVVVSAGPIPDHGFSASIRGQF